MTDIAGGTIPVRPDDRTASVLRFTVELIAWAATPWALADRSWLLAALSVVLLIGLPTCFSTPGDKAHVIIAVPGWVTILLVLLQLAAAVASSWLAWPAWAAGPVTLLAAATLVTERRRWRWLSSRRTT
ncbi:hypothetical protein [Streptomyces poonensis]|uniref:Uncharacterized protein n=1 Tax=Streptomyces poonensis TaxID=68255 RepID=A0A918PEG5_9ACTN|nr:hypothetical protein [Streptomyces poonensis]GGZ03275.1 hypothetical protein GCM10010365_22550 [Streptomyces poonensis]GLJ92975.1 hypothetical protein GCM10017589_55860 [Streptomyces poonensis]